VALTRRLRPVPRSLVVLLALIASLFAVGPVAGVASASAVRAHVAATSVPTSAPAFARVYRNGARTQKVIALTFDDGYSPTATRAILRILLADHVAATFFPYGRAMKLDPSLWKEIAAAGYPIGNHTYSHPNLAHLSSAGVISQLTMARATIHSITGRTEPAIVRPPYGAYTTATREAAARAGYPTMVVWDVDSRDWAGLSVAAITTRAEAGRHGSIVLMHAGPPNTPRALPAIIASYRARGYTFVTVPQLLGISWP
jgi:peptidoglycan/xylan/chitin deacetylase (PgdA/CDA1 family)